MPLHFVMSADTRECSSTFCLINGVRIIPLCWRCVLLGLTCLGYSSERWIMQHVQLLPALTIAMNEMQSTDGSYTHRQLLAWGSLHCAIQPDWTNSWTEFDGIVTRRLRDNLNWIVVFELPWGLWGWTPQFWLYSEELSLHVLPHGVNSNPSKALTLCVLSWRLK